MAGAGFYGGGRSLWRVLPLVNLCVLSGEQTIALLLPSAKIKIAPAKESGPASEFLL